MQAAQAQLSEALYQAAAESSAWLAFMQLLVKVSDSRSARLLVLDKSATQVERSIKVNIDDGFHQQYVDYYVNACPWRPELREKPAGQLYSTYLDFSCPQKQFLQTEFYTDWARPQQIHHGMCGTIYEDESQTVQILIQRTPGPGHYCQREKEFMNTMLVPHLRRACQLSVLYARLESKGRAVAEAANHSSLPFALLDDSGKAVYASPGAERIFSEDDGLTLRQERLRARHPKTQSRLAQLIDQAKHAARGAWDSAGGLLDVERGDGSVLTLLISPIAVPSEPLLFAPRQSFVGVFFYDRCQPTVVSDDILRRLYGLTPAEARVAASIARGETLNAVAARQHKSDHTLRSQLKAALKKTKTSSQAQLVNLILTGPAAKRSP